MAIGSLGAVKGATGSAGMTLAGSTVGVIASVFVGRITGVWVGGRIGVFVGRGEGSSSDADEGVSVSDTTGAGAALDTISGRKAIASLGTGRLTVTCDDAALAAGRTRTDTTARLSSPAVRATSVNMVSA